MPWTAPCARVPPSPEAACFCARTATSIVSLPAASARKNEGPRANPAELSDLRTHPGPARVGPPDGTDRRPRLPGDRAERQPPHALPRRGGPGPDAQARPAGRVVAVGVVVLQ